MQLKVKDKELAPAYLREWFVYLTDCDNAYNKYQVYRSWVMFERSS